MLDEKTQELVAIGAAITANCQPCLDYHVAKAREVGVDAAAIRAAIEVGKQVRRGASLKMDRYAAGLAGGDAPPAPGDDCASDRDRRLEAIDAPVLLMQGNPRQVVTGNRRALELFGKTLPEVAGHRGGEVFDCLHSFSAAGCGKDAHCERCVIRGAIVDTFETGTPHSVAATLPVNKAGILGYRALHVSTERLGDLALVCIERYDDAVPAST